MLSLPDHLRDAFKEPLGPVFTDADELLEAAGTPIIAVGDVVTYHLRQAGHDPAVAVIDGRTERRAVSEEIRAVLSGDNPRIEAVNEPGTLSEELLAALRDALAMDGPTVIVVYGEEDLATLPALLVAPEGASVVYGQPGEGMVHVPVTDETRTKAQELMEQMEGDVGTAFDVLEGDGSPS